MNRRYAQDAGPSWRKFGEPRIEYAPIHRRYPWGFWAFCAVLGAMGGGLLAVLR